MNLTELWNSTPIEIRTALITACSLLVTAISGAIIALLKFGQKRSELKQAEQEYQLTKIKLETEKMVLENKLIMGTYTICPNCGSKLLITDLVFQNDYAKEEK